MEKSGIRFGNKIVCQCDSTLGIKFMGYYRSGRKRVVSPLLVQYDFRTKLPEESWQPNIVSAVATLVFKAVESTC